MRRLIAFAFVGSFTFIGAGAQTPGPSNIYAYLDSADVYTTSTGTFVNVSGWITGDGFTPSRGVYLGPAAQPTSYSLWGSLWPVNRPDVCAWIHTVTGWDCDSEAQTMCIGAQSNNGSNACVGAFAVLDITHLPPGDYTIRIAGWDARGFTLGSPVPPPVVRSNVIVIRRP